MANLGPQHINLSYSGLLQVPNGVTSVLQSVTDGNGTSSGLQISTTGIGGQITSSAVLITGGYIDSTPIGSNVPSTGAFSTLRVTGTTTLSTALTGILKASAGVVSNATAGTDYVSPSVLAQPNGVATLDSSGYLTTAQIPPIAIVQYLGTVNSQAAMLALTGQQGDWCIRSDLGTTWVITGSNPAVIGSWTQLSYPTAPVTSVNTQTGAVSLSYSDVGAAPATTGSSILYANGSGGFSNVTIGTNLSFAGGTLSATTTGIVTSLSVASSNGFAGTSSGGSTPILTLSTTVSGLLKGDGTAISAATAGTDYQSAITATGVLKGAGSGTVSSAVSGTDYAPGTSALATGIVKSTTSTGALSIAVVGTDYAPATTGTSILKGNGSGGFSNATSGTDYAPATSGTSLLKGNGSGGFSNATSGTDYAPATSGTSILCGSGSGGFSNVTVGSGLTFVGGTLASTAGGGSVTTVSVVSANGFAGTVANASSTPAITLTTSVTGLLKGNGTAISAATSGTDYAPATSGTSILKGNGTGGFSSAAAGTDYAVPTSGTSILYGNGSGGFSNVTVGTGLSFSAGTLSNSSTMTYPGAGLAVSTGSAWGTSKTAPTGTVVGTSDTQTLTNKTLVASGTNTIEATSGPTSTQLAGMRNKIINGAMGIWQRGTTFTNVTSGTYTADRFQVQTGGINLTVTQSTTVPSVAFKYSLKAAPASNATPTECVIRQFMEQQNIYDFAGSSVTLSVWVYCSKTTVKTRIGTQNATGGTDSSQYNTVTANTWTKLTYTVTSYSAVTAWTSATTDSGGFLDIGFADSTALTTSDYIYITGVQLEKGTIATPFEFRPYGAEELLCKRYYEALGGADLHMVSGGLDNPEFRAIPRVFWNVTKRASPTTTVSGTAYTLTGTLRTTSLVTRNANVDGANISMSLAPLSSGTVTHIAVSSVTASAELQ